MQFAGAYYTVMVDLTQIAFFGLRLKIAFLNEVSHIAVDLQFNPKFATSPNRTSILYTYIFAILIIPIYLPSEPESSSEIRSRSRGMPRLNSMSRSVGLDIGGRRRSKPASSTTSASPYLFSKDIKNHTILAKT